MDAGQASQNGHNSQHAHQRTAHQQGPNRAERRNEGRRRQRAPRERRTTTNARASLKIASLNIKGFASRTDTTHLGKWAHMRQFMRDGKIGVLALQETHLCDARHALVEQGFAERLLVLHSACDQNPTGARGVAFVINRQLLDGKDAQATEIIPGRALYLHVPWHNEKALNILNVYAPNDPAENAEFWATLEEAWDEHHLPLPDLIVGDFNVVTEAGDRLPQREDPQAPAAALLRLCTKLGVRDGWREANPDGIEFTFPQQLSQNQPARQSRLDRIYASLPVLQRSLDWNIEPTGGISTDHYMVSVRVTDPECPQIGPGRWTLPVNLLSDKSFQDSLYSLTRQLERDVQQIAGQRSDEHNPQKLLRDFKTRVREVAQKRAKKVFPPIVTKLEKLKADLRETLRDPTVGDPGPAQQHAAVLKQEIARLAAQRHWKAKNSART